MSSETETLAAEMRLLGRGDLAEWISGKRMEYNPSKEDVIIARTTAIRLRLYEAHDDLLVPVRVC